MYIYIRIYIRLQANFEQNKLLMKLMFVLDVLLNKVSYFLKIEITLAILALKQQTDNLSGQFCSEKPNTGI